MFPEILGHFVLYRSQSFAKFQELLDRIIALEQRSAGVAGAGAPAAPEESESCCSPMRSMEWPRFWGFGRFSRLKFMGSLGDLALEGFLV